MDSRERARAALAREPVDRVPFGEFFVEDGLVAALAGRSGEPVGLRERRRVLESLGQDLVVAYPTLPSGEPMLHVAVAARQRPRDLVAPGPVERFGLPRPNDLGWQGVRAWREDSPFFTLMMLPGPFAELAYLSGLEQFLVGTRRDPGATRRLAEGMVDYALVLAERAFLAGAQGFLIGEDLAWDRGLFLRRETYAELFLPALHRQRATLRSLGLPVLLHSDGAFGDLLEDLAEVGLDGLHGLQPSAGIELGALKARFGDRWCLWGNLELDVIAAATPRILEQTVSETLRVGAATPGFIFGSSAGVLGADLPAERVRATYDLARALAEAGPSPISGNC